MDFKRLNLDDIARLAGVSRTTASRVMNNHPDVSAATREKVQRVMAENNFYPNLVARMLATKRTRIIGVVVQDLPATFNSPFVAHLMVGIHEVAVERDYATLLWWQESNTEEDHFSPRILQQNHLMDGLIVTAATVDMPLLDQLIQFDIPFVMTEHPNHPDSRISHVSVDNVNGAMSAVEHLLRLGRKRIAHITGLPNSIDGHDRLKGYRLALEKHGIPYDPALVVRGRFTRRSGYMAVKELIERGIDWDAVFVGNDDSAYGALKALEEARLRVPDDIAVVGFDDLPDEAETTPILTTVRQSIKERAKLATTLLLDLLEERVDGPQQILLPTELVVRETCGAAQFQPSTS